MSGAVWVGIGIKKAALPNPEGSSSAASISRVRGCCHTIGCQVKSYHECQVPAKVNFGNDSGLLLFRGTIVRSALQCTQRSFVVTMSAPGGNSAIIAPQLIQTIVSKVSGARGIDVCALYE